MTLAKGRCSLRSDEFLFSYALSIHLMNISVPGIVEDNIYLSLFLRNL